MSDTLRNILVTVILIFGIIIIGALLYYGSPRQFTVLNKYELNTAHSRTSVTTLPMGGTVPMGSGIYLSNEGEEEVTEYHVVAEITSNGDQEYVNDVEVEFSNYSWYKIGSAYLGRPR